MNFSAPCCRLEEVVRSSPCMIVSAIIALASTSTRNAACFTSSAENTAERVLGSSVLPPHGTRAPQWM